MSIIKTPDQIHPENIYLTPEQYKAIKHAKMNKAFKIKNKEIADIIQVSGIVKPEEIRVSNRNTNNEEFIFPTFNPTGKYLLQLKGDYYIKYKKSQNVKECKEGFHKWATLIIAILALFMSGLSLLLDYLQMTITK